MRADACSLVCCSGGGIGAGEGRDDALAQIAKRKERRNHGALRISAISRTYALNDFPQPQLPPVALGFVTENPAPRKSST